MGTGAARGRSGPHGSGRPPPPRGDQRCRAKPRARVDMGLAGQLLVPGIATLWTAWHKFGTPSVPDLGPFIATGLGAFAVNLLCVVLMVRQRRADGSLTPAAFLALRNDAIGNIAVVLAALMTAFRPSHWPDLVVGLGLVVLNAGAASEVFRTARAEQRG